MFSDLLKSRLQSALQGELLWDEPLGRYTTLKIGGPADALYFPATIEALAQAVQTLRQERIPYCVIGNGSNLLIRDQGVRGVVIRLQKLLHSFETEEGGGQVSIRAESGVMLPKIVEWAKQNGWSGIESLYGIPGTVGGAIAMNAGTREGEIGERVLEVTVLDGQGRIKTYPREKLEFDYRHLKLAKQEILLKATLALDRSSPEKVLEKTAFFQKRRLQTQPLNQPNVGSVFKNPKGKKFAAQLIEELGLKGVRVGGARISEKHANWIVNEGGASAKDVLVLIHLVQDKIKEVTGIKLEPEVKIIGEQAD